MSEVDESHAKNIKTIGIMTCGGDCPGLNPVIRAATLTAINKYGWKVIGIEDSMQGLINLDYKGPHGNVELTEAMVQDILTRGGTILGSDNASDPFRFGVLDPATGKKVETDVSDQVLANFKKLGLDALICIGGDGTMNIVKKLSEKGHFPAVGVPKTIDNDLDATDYTFGFNTAVQTISEACDKIRDTARSHDRVVIVEVMGRDAGWLALHGGISGAADIILIPEIPYDVDTIAQFISAREQKGNPFCVIVIAEGCVPNGGSASYLGERETGRMQRYGGAGLRLQMELAAHPDNRRDIRTTVLGYTQRGGSPTNFDRILGTRYGEYACHLIAQAKFGHIAALKTPDIVPVPFSVCCAKQKLVDPEGQLVKCAETVGICLGRATKPTSQ